MKAGLATFLGVILMLSSAMAHDRVAEVFTKTQTNQFIGETKQSLLPGYRYWLVECGGQKALFGISQIGGAFGAACAALALVVPDPDVAQQFADMLPNEKKSQTPEN
ncbi:hypothetical protein ELI20_12170 [Rhizobium ruizarguesonis]|uniref:hypothetical protein n=1 Tax=Rhizobium ruizarguesonis TaxID=2081791 RepID=UPI0010303B3F|nr:hypothetical protein [Rhizobium ruizarguesonis]TAU31731.1 hypothetical protein ELI47_11970 [Rhizobium ruizarguesonis]TAW21894.1 hypothetical protein ELI20_12170 [Rhizobium ruizarguesonis]